MKKIDYHNKLLTPAAKALRKNMTPCEKKLYKEFLQHLDFHTYKQRVILNAIVDFYIPVYKLVIEVDGDYHLTELQKKEDKGRTVTLRENGFTVIRIPNKSIEHDFENVKRKLIFIFNKMKSRCESPLPL